MMNLVKTPKGVIAVLLVLCLVFCPLANLPAIAETQEEIVYWDGTKYSDLATTQASMEGEGTEASPYIVTTPKQLYSLIYYQGGGAYYQLANDIYINEGYENYLNWDATTKPARGWTSGTGRANFSGTLDGAGYTVYGLYNHVTASTSFSGLIPGLSYSSATSAVIKNLNVKNSYVAGKRFVGVICGGPYTKGGTLSISNCTVSECKVNAITDNACAGSIVGIARNTTVNNCAATDVTFITGGNNTVRSGYAGMGAIIGSSYISTGTGAWNQEQADSTKITNSYSVNVKLVLSEEDERLLYPTGIFSEESAASYCISAKNVYTDATTIPSHVTIPAISVLVSSTDDTSAAIDPTSENYPIKTITAESIKGNLALDTMPGLAWGSEWVSVLEDYPIPEGGNIPGYWDGWQGDEYDSLSAVQASMEGTGTKDDPYIITDADQLYAAIYYGGGSFSSIGAVGTCYELANDLYLNVGYKNYAEWDTTTPVNKWMSNSGSTDFNGTIDGAGHTIYGYYNSGAYTGLIPYIDAGTSTDVTLYVKNLNMAYSAVVNANWRTAFLFAGTPGGGRGGNQVNIDGCSVRNSEMFDIYGSACNGAIVGLAGRRTVVNNCAVSDVTFNYTANYLSGHPTSNTPSKEFSIGTFVGGAISGAASNDTTVSAASNCYITVTNSYSVNNILNNARDNTVSTVYPIGINQNWNNYYYCAVAQNIYTDSTAIPSYTYNSYNPTLKLVLPGGTTEVTSDMEDYPITVISSENIIGEEAKTTMPKLNWALYWATVENGYPIPEDNSEGRVWDGTGYSSIEAAGMAGSGTEADPYVITNGSQLYTVVKYNGGGYHYVIAEDIVLNDDYLDYENWDTSAPSNKWLSGSGYDFIGNIDGQGHTIYGLYGTGSNVGLIPFMNNTPYDETVSIKNINITHSAIINAGSSAGFILGNIYWSGGARRLEINGCSVRNSKFTGIEDNGGVGSIIGRSCSTSVKVTNCSAANVTFTAKGSNTSFTGWNAMGGLIGTVYTGSSYSDTVNTSATARFSLTNSFAVNCVRTNDGKVIYPVGIGGENGNGVQRYFISLAANNVYTDADITDVPSVTVAAENTQSGEEITFSLKVVSTADTKAVIAATDENYPIKQVTVDGIKGEAAKTAMPNLNWCCFETVANSIPAGVDNHIEVEVAEVPATCTANGLTAGSKCSTCGETIKDQNVIYSIPHDYSSEAVATEYGYTVTCGSGCGAVKFMADVTVDEVNFKTEADVLKNGTEIAIQKLTEGTEYDAAISAIVVDPKVANVYSITATLDGAEVDYSGAATLSITVPEEWNSTKAVICQLTDDGMLRKVSTTLENSVATASIGVNGVYVLVNLSGITTNPDVNGDGKANSEDLTLLRKYLLEMVDESEIAGTVDVNIDTYKDIRDLVRLKKHIAGIK